jgi:LemA protein
MQQIKGPVLAKEIDMAWIVVLILIAPAAVFTASYNRLLLARTALKNAFAQIDVLLTRRYGLVPNLVATARRYLEHERDTLEAVIRSCKEAEQGLRRAADDPGSATAVHQLSGADGQLEGALGQLMALAQSHPALKESHAMRLLGEEMRSAERRVAYARQAYNQAVITYNSDRERFPGSVCAGLFGFEPAYPLEITRPLGGQAPSVT